jgi:hypothetical protein
MSYSIWLLRFEDGSAATMDFAAFEAATAPYVHRRGPQHNFLMLRMPDGGEADVYATREPDGTLESVMLTHFSRGAILDIVAEAAKALGAAVVLQEGVALVADATQHDHLVPDPRPDASLVELEGAAIQAVIDRP